MNLNESYVNCFGDDRNKYVDDVIRILQTAYASLGGVKGLDNPKELLEDDIFFKLVRRNNKIVACAVYKFKNPRNSKVSFFDPKRNERKLKYIGSDGSAEGNQGVRDIMREDITRPERGFWAEISTPKLEHMYIESKGAVPIPNRIAKDILASIGKKVIKLDDDGYHYWRLIGESPLRKMLIGNANIKSQGLQHRPEVIDIFDNTQDWDISMAREDESLDVDKNLSLFEYFKKSME